MKECKCGLKCCYEEEKIAFEWKHGFCSEVMAFSSACNVGQKLAGHLRAS